MTTLICSITHSSKESEKDLQLNEIVPITIVSGRIWVESDRLRDLNRNRALSGSSRRAGRDPRGRSGGYRDYDDFLNQPIDFFFAIYRRHVEGESSLSHVCTT
jgi:hypothetical protein